MKSIKKISVHVERLRLEESAAPYAKHIASSREIYPIAKQITQGLEQEVFLVFFLDAKNKITGYQEVSRGSQLYCAVAPSDVFRAAILQGAVSIVVCHNHPSGDPTPSDADVEITKRLCKAGELLLVKILDHVIIGHDRYYSFCDDGRMLGGVS